MSPSGRKPHSNIILNRAKPIEAIRIAAAILLAALFTCAQTAHTARVVDALGSPVAGAAVTFLSKGNRVVVQRTTTGSDGTFAPPEQFDGIVVVDAEGFALFEKTWDASTSPEIRLEPRPLAATVSVTGAAGRINETAASVTVLERSRLESSAAVTLDDKLRQVPGFSLFRRAGSRTANPTTAGVSLRGVGASGASRALVIVDGIPLNDPFGGWIYWGRVPAESVGQVEVLRGPASDIYGNSAIGGVVSIVPRKAVTEPTLEMEISYGTQNTSNVSVFASAGLGDFSGSLAAEVFRTDGFIPVTEQDRGAVDTEADVKRWGVNPDIDWQPRSGVRAFVRSEFYSEVRRNGTPLQNNDTSIRRFAAGVDLGTYRFGHFTLRGYGGPQLYHQSFSAPAADRASETLSRLQTSPSRVVGLSARWAANFGTRNLFTAGIEGRRVSGRSDETGFAGGRATSVSSTGGTEVSAGAYAGILAPVTSRLTLSGGVRYDRWSESSGFSTTRSLTTNAVTSLLFPDRTETAVSPRASVLFKLAEGVSAFASYSTGFRQPTLNELYRSFRVGNVLTLANENLRAERAANFEGGLNLTRFSGRVYARGGAFCTTVSRPVANLTLSVTPAVITRQRQNLGETRTCGIELDAEARVTDAISVSSGYLFADPTVTDFPPENSLEGLRVPQVPRHQFSAQFRYSDPEIVTAALQFRSASAQFDDDRNVFRLRPYATLDAFVSRRLTANVELFAAVENLFDTQIESGRTPVLSLAGPRSFRFGLRLRFR